MNIVLSEVAYYRLKSRMLEAAQMRAQAQALITQRETLALQEAGLDPSKAYMLTDKDFTVTEVPRT